MYQKMLVPLDGSKLAECVLPHVKSIASGCGIKEVVLLRVVEPTPPEAPPAMDFEAVQKAALKAAEEYLAKIRAELSKEGLDVEAKVLTGRPAETIADFAQHNKVDIVAIATHGRSGISRWVFGSVADRLVRSLSAPVLLIRPSGCESGN
ncbi:MAG: universal stress protein [Dehalococcoidia bacterium]|jgi:nucleotide-binding universal stress UspA family protein